MKDPRVPLAMEHRMATICRQVAEVIQGMLADNPDVFIQRQADLNEEIDGAIADINKKMSAKDVTGEALEHLADRVAYHESRRRTPDQLEADEARRIIGLAMAVLENHHAGRMAARLAHFNGTCRFDGCCKKPQKHGRKPRLFCRAHSFALAFVGKSLARTMLGKPELRVVID